MGWRGYHYISQLKKIFFRVDKNLVKYPRNYKSIIVAGVVVYRNKIYALGGMGVSDDLVSVEVFNSSTKVQLCQNWLTFNLND